MKRLKKIENMVEEILNVREDARRNDDILYLYVCKHVDESVSSVTMEDFLLSRNQTAFPSYVSVTRARRKIFKARPELKPADVTKLREDMVEVYVDYALNG